ncbi:Hypothetical protein EAG7_03761 [Klebsiella aerogenes]|nr:Hypothetical protein EAG7_03761 [Klebsiella aerogenes]CCG32257.1 hypothetical protein [Klebsiella aerogenes EA1509E]
MVYLCLAGIVSVWSIVQAGDDKSIFRCRFYNRRHISWFFVTSKLTMTCFSSAFRPKKPRTIRQYPQ